MVAPIVVAFGLGIVGSVGAKIGTDHVYPWLIKNIDFGKGKIAKIAADLREKYNIEQNMKDIK